VRSGLSIGWVFFLLLGGFTGTHTMAITPPRPAALAGGAPDIARLWRKLAPCRRGISWPSATLVASAARLTRTCFAAVSLALSFEL
jgi:hypothetical protein